jgi:hypothetical protein
MQGDESISAPTGHLSLRTNLDIVACRQRIRSLAQQLRFSEVGETMLVTAASEFARNTVVYGGGGILEWEVVCAFARYHSLTLRGDFPWTSLRGSTDLFFGNGAAPAQSALEGL